MWYNKAILEEASKFLAPPPLGQNGLNGQNGLTTSLGAGTCSNLSKLNPVKIDRVELALVLEPLIAAKAKERKLSGLKQNKSVVENSPQREDAGRTVEHLAEISGVSTNTIRRAKIIKEHGTPEQMERARSGRLSVNWVFRPLCP